MGVGVDMGFIREIGFNPGNGLTGERGIFPGGWCSSQNTGD